MPEPQGTLLFFWDYDTQWGIDRSRIPGRPPDLGKLEFEHTERILELHARFDVPACFAIVGAAALPGERPYCDPAQIRSIHSMGHEIASHSFRHEWLPGLGRRSLLEALRTSKDALEQCVGSPVVTFVPPYNQPFDYPQALAFSLSERRQAKPHRTDLRRLCDGLEETGYRFCRVSYRPLPVRLAEWLARRPVRRSSPLKRIGGINCVRLNTPGGFAQTALDMVEWCARFGGIAVVYGHPHSLQSGNAQDEVWLVPFLQRVSGLRRQGRLRICQPRDLI